MKRFISVLLAFITIMAAVPSLAEDITEIRIGFEEEIFYDFEGNIKYEKGVVGNCAVFDGKSYIKLSEDITKDVEDFTVSCWVRFDNITPNVWQRVFDFGNTDGSNLFLGTWQWQGGNNVRSTFMGSQLTTYGAYSLGEWVHYAVTQKGYELKFYLNGREVASGENTKRLKDCDCTQNYIGFYNKNTEPTEGLRGAVDEFMFVPYAMCDEEINEMAFVGLGPEKKVESLEKRVYLSKNNDDSFNYFTFDDGESSVTWKSSDSEKMTVDGIVTEDKELCDVTLTAVIKAGDCIKKIDFQYVVGEIDGKITCRNTTLEKIEIDSIRKTSINIDTDKTYYLKANGKYLADIDSNPVMQDNADENALWRFYKSPKINNTYAIFNIKSGKCFDVENFKTEKGSNVILYPGGKGINQLWYVTEDGGIIGYQSEWFLNDDFTLHGLGDYTKWNIEETENTLVQTGEIYKEPQSKFVKFDENYFYSLKCKKGYLATNEEVYIEKNKSSKNAQWIMTHIENDYYTVVNGATGKTINIAGHNVNKGANVIMWPGAAGANEQFIFEDTGLGILIQGRDNKNYLEFTESLKMNNAFFWDIEKCGKRAVVESKKNSFVTDYIPPVREEVSEEGFIHPGILVTKDDIIRMQKMVREGKEPWTSAFEKLANDGFSRKNITVYAYHSNADTTALKVESRLKNMRMDSRAVANQALMYVITGDEVYRENAMTILRMWSNLRDVYVTLGSDWIDHGESAFKMAFAAELMKYTDSKNPDLKWTDEDNEKFVDMLETLRPKHDGNFRWMNQHSICNLGTMANAIFRDDMDLYKIAVERTTVNKGFGGSLNYAHGSGGSITQVFRIVDFDALNGDIIEPTFVHAEMGRDQGHAYGDLAALSILAQMTDSQNTKVDPVTGEVSNEDNAVSVFDFADERLVKGGNYMAKYNLGYDVSHPTIDTGSLYNDINDLNRGNIYVAFGILYNHYKYDKKVNMNEEEYRYLKEAHEYHYPEGGINDFYIGYSDLLFTPEDAECDMSSFARLGESGTTWQAENFTAVNCGVAEKCDGYAKITLTDKAQVGLTNGHTPPSVRGHVVLKVKTNSEVKVVLQSEHTVFAPFVTGIIPDTDAQWQEIIFEVESEGVMRGRNFFMTFFGEDEICVDYMKFVE